MKRNLIVLLFLSIGFTADSQVLISLLFGDKLNSPNVEFGIDGGANFGQIANLEKSKMLPMFNLGFYFDIKLKNQLMLHTGVIVKSTQGADQLDVYSLQNAALDSVFTSGYISRKINQFSVPILIKYRFGTYFHVEAGPMLALRSKGNDFFWNEVKDKDDLSYRADIADNYKRIDAGIMAGAGFKLSKLPKTTQFGIRYYYGLIDPLKDNPGKAQYFSSLYLYCSIPIGVHKAEPKPE